MSTESLYTLLSELIAVRAPSGREHSLAAYVTSVLSPLVEECHTDRVGNVIGYIKGNGTNKKKLLYCAHMDEVGMIVSSIGENGYIHFTNDGGPNMYSAEYREVVFEHGARGMVVPLGGCEKDPYGTNCVVDIGASSREEAEALVSVGETFAPIGTLMPMAGTVVAGRPIDNRIGMAAALLAAKELHDRGTPPYHDVYFAFTVQEELALPAMGASVASFAVNPDIGIAVDVCATGDTMGSPPPVDVRLGGGAVIVVRDTTLIADRDLVDSMAGLCRENGIPCQKLVSFAGGQDAVPMQKTGLGCRAGVISIPMRYLHTSAETADLSDALHCVSLIKAVCDCETL